MKNDSHVTISRLFDEVQLCLRNAAEHPEIQKKLNQHGFNQKRLLDGMALLDTSKALHSEKSKKYGEKMELAKQIKANRLLALQTFEDHVTIVRFVFRKMPDALARFNVERIDKGIQSWTMQASYFYQEAKLHEEMLAQHGLSGAEMDQAMAMIEAVSTVRSQRMLRKGEAEEATRNRDQSVKALKAWMKDFRAIARVALSESPQMLEALGIVVKSQKV
ncbi:hypothetical protein [Catalinimonas niigatensis]|uniref:hypothetical protein n=1 Tax=Catalinimonas niigatensis TaxID=1397264 RepID=UPI0026666092|nr:hypothetical protein [Catalinimonas niigatensis]WPP50820.1 hypothetical protein PZB72_00230 [Catalinimonas niigatensis]